MRYSSKIICLILLATSAWMIGCAGSPKSVEPEPSPVGDTIPPFVLEVSPVDGEDHVSLRATATVTFSELVDAATINLASFIVGDSLPGRYSQFSEQILWHPDEEFDYLTSYTVTLTDSLQDTIGNKLPEPYIWQFTTRPEQGFEWQTVPAGTGEWLHGAIWADTMFVVVGANGAILASTDGMSWSQKKGKSAWALFDLAWSGSNFVAVGTPREVYASQDGIDWTVHSHETDSWIHGICWTGSQFVAVGEKGAVIISSDGKTWSSYTAPTSQVLLDVLWSGTSLIAVGSGGVIFNSSDGQIWTAASQVPTTDELWGVAQSEDLFVAVGGNGITVVSSDANIWQLGVGGSGESLSDVTWSDRFARFIAVGDEGTILHSSNGSDWTTISSGTTATLTGLVWSDVNRAYVATGFNALMVSP